MRYWKHFIIFIGIFFIFITGCSNGIEIEGNEIVVQKRVGEENKYEEFRKITDEKEVQKVKDILADIDWENAVVDMISPPHYKFCFVDTQTELVMFDLWISPNNDQVELVIDSESKYAQLDKDNSAKLFKMITGTELSEGN